MKLCLALLVVALAVWSGVLGVWKCEQDSTSPAIRTFTGYRVAIKLPCKYNAVRQQCGNYNITLSPGIVMIGKQDRLNTVWLGVKDSDGRKWEGRTTNKMAVKYVNGLSNGHFAKKNEDGLETSEVLNFSHNGHSAFAEATDGSFRVSFTPSDPDRTDLKKATWAFECFDESMIVVEYPRQVCGANDTHGFKHNPGPNWDIVNDDGLTPDQLFVYNVLTEKRTSIFQEDERCLKAEDIIQHNCTSNRRRKEAIVTCSQIVNDKVRRRCVTRYSCSSMQVFVECMQWVCGRYKDKELCENLGSTIDMCNEFKEGNLTRKVQDKNCYKDLFNILP